MSLSLGTAHFYILVHDYNRQVREARECRDDNDQGEFYKQNSYGICIFREKFSGDHLWFENAIVLNCVRL